MISKTFLYYPGYETKQEVIDWIKNALVSHCGMSISVDTSLLTGSSGEYYCVLKNSARGRLWIQSDSYSFKICLAHDNGEMCDNIYNYITVNLGSYGRRVVIHSKNGMHFFDGKILLNVPAKEIYGQNLFSTNTLFYINTDISPFIGYYGEAVFTTVKIFSYLGLRGSSNIALTMKYNDTRYYIPNLFIVGQNFPAGTEFVSENGDCVSIRTNDYCSACVCMDHILT